MTKSEIEQLNIRISAAEKEALQATYASQLIGKDIGYIRQDVSEIKANNKQESLSSQLEMKKLRVEIQAFINEMRENYATKKSVEEQDRRIGVLETFKTEIMAKAAVLSIFVGMCASFLFSFIKDRLL